MDAESIGVAAAVVGSGIAGFALLLSWHRSREEKSSLAVAIIGGMLVIAMLLGVTFAFVLGPGAPGEQEEPLTEDQYRQQAGSTCSELKDEGERLSAAKPQEPPLGIMIKIEEKAVERLNALHPPASLKHDHEKAVAIWERRTDKLESTLQRKSHLSDDELFAEFEASAQLAVQLTDLFKNLDVPECSMT